MRKGILALGLFLAALSGPWLTRAVGCPYCKVAAAGLAENDQSSSEEPGNYPLMLSGGFDVASSYFFRGYLQADHGLILQPYMNLFTAIPLGEGAVLRPYVSLFNSTHFASNNRMAEMSDGMIGAITTWNGFVFDARYAYYNMSPLMRSNVHELGAKASFDVLSLWHESDSPGPFSLRPFVGLYGELSDQKGTEEIFLNVGLEPSWRFKVAGQSVGISLPIDWGLSPDGYYLNYDNSNAIFGYFATALTTSVALPVLDKCGQWYLNGSIQYLHLAAQSVVAINGGDRDVCIGKLGLAFVF